VAARMKIGFIAGLCLALPIYAKAQSDTLPPLPDRNPGRIEVPVSKPSEPPASEAEAQVGTEAEKPVPPGQAAALPWTAAEIATAIAGCTNSLAELRLDYERLPPIKEGLCGASAPIRVSSIGDDPKVTIEPPAIINCKLAVALALWLKVKVQPEAMAAFGSPVVKLHNAASYACRNRYGSATAPLSEHALANAIDISEFVLASGQHVSVLDSWPRVISPTALAPNPAGVAAAPPLSETSPPDNNAAEPAGDTLQAASSNPFEAISVNRFRVTDKNLGGLAGTNPFVIDSIIVEAAKTKVATAPPSTPPDAPLAPGSFAERKTEFVRRVHAAACAMFGTTLGPGANAAHKNHFHLDMKSRRRAGFCQ
jgi:hypothetical protein